MFKYLIILFFLFKTGQSLAANILDPEQLNTVCQDAEAVGQIMQVYQTGLIGTSPVAATPDASGKVSLALALAESVPKYCTLLNAVLAVKNLESALEAARVANSLGIVELDNQLDFYDRTTSFVNFAEGLAADGKLSKDELLNVSNHQTMVNFYTTTAFPAFSWAKCKLSTCPSEQDQTEHDKNLSEVMSKKARLEEFRRKLTLCYDETSKKAEVKATKDKVYIQGMSFKNSDMKTLNDAKQIVKEVIDVQNNIARQYYISLNAIVEDYHSYVHSTGERLLTDSTIIDNIASMIYVANSYETPRTSRVGPGIKLFNKKTTVSPKQSPDGSPSADIKTQITTADNKTYSQFIDSSSATVSDEEVCKKPENQFQVWVIKKNSILANPALDRLKVLPNFLLCPANIVSNSKTPPSVTGVTSEAFRFRSVVVLPKNVNDASAVSSIANFSPVDVNYEAIWKKPIDSVISFRQSRGYTEQKDLVVNEETIEADLKKCKEEVDRKFLEDEVSTGGYDNLSDADNRYEDCEKEHRKLKSALDKKLVAVTKDGRMSIPKNTFVDTKIKTLGDWKTYMGNEFTSFLRMQNKAYNPTAVQKSTGTFDDIFADMKSKTYDDKTETRVNVQVKAFNQRYRPYSPCMDLSVLYERANQQQKEKLTKKLNKGVLDEADQTEIGQIRAECMEKDSDDENLNKLFEDNLKLYVKALTTLNYAEKIENQIDLLIGAYSSTFDNRNDQCDQKISPAERDYIESLMMADLVDSMNTIVAQQESRYREEQAKAAEELAQQKKIEYSRMTGTSSVGRSIPKGTSSVTQEPSGSATMSKATNPEGSVRQNKGRSNESYVKGDANSGLGCGVIAGGNKSNDVSSLVLYFMPLILTVFRKRKKNV